MSATMRLVRGSIIDLGKKEEQPGGIDKDTSKSQCPQVASHCQANIIGFHTQ